MQSCPRDVRAFLQEPIREQLHLCSELIRLILPLRLRMQSMRQTLPQARERATGAFHRHWGRGRRAFFGAEAASFLRPPATVACAGWVQRWSGILAVAAMRAFAASLLDA